MKLHRYLFFLITTNFINAQKNDVIKWIDSNAIPLEKNNT